MHGTVSNCFKHNSNFAIYDHVISDRNILQKTIDYLKMDVEDNEWAAMEAMFNSDILYRVKQFGLEIHLMTHMPTTNEYYPRWKTMKRLEDFGFRRWYWHFNHDGARMSHNGRVLSCCYEMVYINIRFMDLSQTITASSLT